MGRCVYEIPLHFMLTTAVLVMMVMVARMMMMTLVTVVGAVVEGDVCAHEQAICQTAHVITTTVTHCASTNHTFYTLFTFTSSCRVSDCSHKVFITAR